MPNVRELLERERQTVDLEGDHFERLTRRRDRKQRNRRIGALLVAAVLVIATIVGLTNALERRDTTVPVTPPSPKNGRIVFGELDKHESSHLFTINPDGTDVRDLSVDSSCMSWAPDGTKILIGRGSGLATINPDGTGYTALSQPAGIDCGALSPDGTRFVRNANGLYTARISDGGDIVRLTNFCGTYASYSPDGTKVVFTPCHNRANLDSHDASGLWVVNADGTGLHLIARTYAIRPSWSPDGRRILFAGPNVTAIYVARSDGTGLRRIMLQSVPRLRTAIYPSWSPDGTRIVFVGMLSGSDHLNLFTARTDGTDVEQITDTHGIGYFSPDWGTNAG